MTKRTNLLPHSEQCELGLLCSFFHPIGPKSGERAYEKSLHREVKDTWFYDEDRGKLFNTLMQFKKDGREVDLVSFTQHCLDHDSEIKFSHSDLQAWITNISCFTSSDSAVDYYIDQVQKKAAIRFAYVDALKTAEKVKTCKELGELSECLTGAFIEAKELCRERETHDYDRYAMLKFIDGVEASVNGTSKKEFFPSGLPSVDEECGGFVRGELILVRGRKGTGKSLISGKFVSQSAFSDAKKKVAYFTYEMPYDQVMRRFVADLGTIHLKSMRDGRYTKHELSEFMRCTTLVMNSNLKVYDIPRIKKRTPEAFFSNLRRHHKNNGLDMAVLDHLHLLKFTGKTDKRTDEALHDFSAEFKAVCLELNIVGILLAQENSDGGTFGGTQVETDVDTSFSLTPKWKKINGIDRIIGTDGLFCDKCRDGDLLGKKIPLRLIGQYARIEEGQEVEEDKPKSKFNK